MKKLELYLSENYLKEKEQQKSIMQLIQKVIPTYEKFYDDIGWPYKLGGKAPTKISTSTTAMVAFSMSVLMSGKPDLVIDYTIKGLLEHFKKMDKAPKDTFKSVFEKSLEVLFNTFMNKRIEWTKDKDDEKINSETEVKKECTFESGTYGINDPFTLMWSKYLIDNNKDLIKNFDEIKKAIDLECSELVCNIFINLYEDKNNLGFSSQIESSHIFPLLKIVQLYNALTSCKSNMMEEKYVNEARTTLNNNLHYHLSLASIENSNFDAAELVFSLEGMLILNPNRDNFDQNLLDRVFQVVKERQEISLYWRPLKPFVSNEQGLALLPLSVEIAMSLIRICRLLGNKRGEKLFSKNYKMFKKYTEWVTTRVTVVSCDEECNKCKTKSNCSQKEKKFYGWCSEHIYKPDVIHPWETSQVLVYLVNFIDMQQKHIAYQSLLFANLSNKNCGVEKDSWSKWQVSEPVNQDEFRVYEYIGKKYIDSDESYSMLLYGPPGTGKSTIAEEIAKAKNWPLVTITPSDFIASGADQVETKAKSIFKVLEEQEEMVVLFDEIDRLILDRDSSSYHKQSDLFQFMTPSMLVKLKDLRTKQKIIFIIATNYEERIDMAIKRIGRIDEKYLVLPPDRNGRKNLFNKFELGFIKCEDLVLNNTALYTFTEFKQLSKVLKDKWQLIIDGDGKVIEDDLIKLIKKPAISLMSYKGKLNTTLEDNTQKPIKEFLSLVFLKAETYDGKIPVFDENELDLINGLLGSKEMLSNDTKDKLNKHISKNMTNSILEALEISKIIKELVANKC